MEQLSLFDQAGDLGAPLASRLRPQSLDEFVGQKHLLGEGRMLRQLIERSDFFHDFLGTAGGGQDDIGKDHCPENESGVYRFQRRHQRDPGDPSGDGTGGEQQKDGNAHRCVCGRDPSLQQSTAGCVPSVCGKGKHSSDRGYHGESVF